MGKISNIIDLLITDRSDDFKPTKLKVDNTTYWKLIMECNVLQVKNFTFKYPYYKGLEVEVIDTNKLYIEIY